MPTALYTFPDGETRPLPTPPYVDDDLVNLTDNARTIFMKRYARKSLDGQMQETPAGVFYRVAYHVAQGEPDAAEREKQTEQFYHLLVNRRFFPNSPTFTGAGTRLGQLAACFVLGLEDDMGKDPQGIFSTLRVAALIQQTGGGNGFSFGKLRPKGDMVTSSGGQATGPVGFIEMFNACFEEVSQGGCLLPETLVFTNNGLLRLDEIVKSDSPGWQPHTLTVATDEGTRPSPRGYNNGVQPVLRVETAQGLKITGTPNHKVKVMTATGPVWRRLDELQMGDSLLVKLGQQQGQWQSLRKPPLEPHPNAKAVGLPSLLDEPLAFLLGYLAGDGFVASGEKDYRFGFAVAHTSYLMEELPKLLATVFPGCHVMVQQKEGDQSATFVVQSSEIKRFLALNGFIKAKSHDVVVPALIRRSPPAVVGAFLRGLFEADGTVSHGYPRMQTTSERLAEEVAALLIGLGCPIFLYKVSDGQRLGTHPQWAVRIQSHVGLEAWRRQIGCDPRSRFAVCLSFAPDLTRETSYLLPHAEYWVEPVLEAITLPQRDKRDRGEGKNLTSVSPELRRKLLRYRRGDRNLTASGYALLAADFPDLFQAAPPLNDLWFVQVDRVIPAGEALTLDLEVNDNHTYLASGIVTHNTRRGANMAVLPVHHPDIAEFVACKAEEGKIANFNISVGVTDAFMEAVTRGENFALLNPRNGEVWDTVDARALFDEIVKQAHHNGEPGLLFLDAANRANPVPHLYTLEATNPCVTGDTLVLTPTGERPVAAICVGDPICTVDGEGTVDRVEIYYNRPVFQVTFENEAVLRCTAAHQFWVPTKSRTGYLPVKLESLRVGDEVRSAGDRMPGSQSHLPTTRIAAIAFAGWETVYDLHEPKTDTWITNGIVSRGCGEQWLGPYENCCLGSINLAEHWKVVAGLPVVDWEKLKDSTRLATFFLDDVVTINAYVPVVPELREAAEASRRIGLGIMGLADLLYALHLPYDSEGGRALAGQVMEFVRYYALSTSVDLALERGPFKGYAGSVYDFNQPGGMKWQPPHPTQPTDYAFGRPTLYWESLRRNVEDFGVRNACQTTIAPTGTLSSVAGCEGYGCEPVFALGYIRHFKDGQKDVELPYVSTAFQTALGHLNLGLDTERAILDHVARTGTCQDLTILPEAFRRTFVVSGDIAPRDHVLMQAALQQWVDNSISKTINLPATATPEDVKEVYQLAWELGCKGITVYVTGSRDKVVLETKETQATKIQKADPLAEMLHAMTDSATVIEAAYLERMRPAHLAGSTYRKATPLGKAYITVNDDEQGEPFEVFINVGKAGSETAAVSEGIGRLISLYLRSPSPLAPKERLVQVVEQLIGIGGNRPWGYGNGRVLSLPDGIAQVLNQHLDGGNGHAETKAAAPDVPVATFTLVVGDLCPDCGDATFVQTEGCRKCLACGYSEC